VLRPISAVFSVAATVLLAAPAIGGQKYKGFERDALIPVQGLKHLADARDPKLVVLAVVEPLSYKAGHIPGSINIWRPDYELKVGEPYPFDGMLLERDGFQTFARGLGINNDSKVIVYDEKYDAPRVWWAFYLYGKTDVRVLDGGYAAWTAAGYERDVSLSRGRVPGTGNFTATERRSGWVAGMDDVRRGQTSKQVRVWDAREPEEWSGALKKGNARRAGRIPWAAFQSWKEYRQEVDGKPAGFKTASEVQEVIDKFKMDPRDDNIFYCHSGVRSTTGVFVLYMMGWDPDRLRNYDGSWLEWSHHEGNPILTGQ
jgi:thiosulfate/3-mercaptopyruvate sulfurtransferase